MPRIPDGLRASSLPPRLWAGVLPSWCKCHHQQRGRMEGRVLLSPQEGDEGGGRMLQSLSCHPTVMLLTWWCKARGPSRS